MASRRAPIGEEGATAPAYRIQSPRLVLRPIEVAEAEAFTALIVDNHDHLARYMPWASPPPTLDAQLAVVRRFRANFDQDAEYVYGLFAETSRPIGAVGLHARVGAGGLEIGYWIGAAHEGRGLMTEAVAALVQVAFATLDVDRLEIRMETSNARSARIPARLGFRHEATLPRRVPGRAGLLHDADIWTLYQHDSRSEALVAVPVKAWDGVGRRLV